MQNTAAGLITKSRKHEHITPILNSLHWLPVVNRIKFKILLLVFKIKHGFAPTYLSDLLQPMIPSRSLRSSKHAHLQYTPGPRTYTRYGDRAFSVAAPKLWNNLPIISVMQHQLNVSNPVSSVSCLILLLDYFGLLNFCQIKLVLVIYLTY